MTIARILDFYAGVGKSEYLAAYTPFFTAKNEAQRLFKLDAVQVLGFLVFRRRDDVVAVFL